VLRFAEESGNNDHYLNRVGLRLAPLDDASFDQVCYVATNEDEED
jgi:hypothetical protein